MVYWPVISVSPANSKNLVCYIIMENTKYGSVAEQTWNYGFHMAWVTGGRGWTGDREYNYRNQY
jgi:hypothetical protein